MDSNTHRHNFQTQNHPPSSGLLRFRSAPSSLLVGCAEAAIASGDGSGERLTSGFVDNIGGGNRSVATDFGTEAAVEFGNSPRGRLGLPPQYPRQSSTTPFGLVGSVAANQQTAVNSISNLSRQNSSPAGLFSQLSIQNGFVDMGDLRSGKCDNGETNLSPSAERLKSQLTLSPLGMLSPISEVAAEINVEELSNNPFDQSNGSWDDPMDTMKTEQEDSLCSPQKEGEFGNGIALLSRHLSLPKSWVEMEKLLQYQDFVPYKTRAKRGCATHPRSIAERVRRTRISERMRKLQEVVPNMDKQTNTADMLDLAAEYIKDLQGQFKTLSNHRAKCKCLSSKN